MGFVGASIKPAVEVMRNLYDLFVMCNATLVEVNPLGETPDGKVRCVDAKLNFDDNAEFRQEDIFELRDRTQEDPREIAASAYVLKEEGKEYSS
jgi:succinyl-CoA synthetase beta subunit